MKKTIQEGSKESSEKGSGRMAIVMWLVGIPLPFILLYWVACN